MRRFLFLLLFVGASLASFSTEYVDVFEAGKEKVTYVKMNPEKAQEVIEKHLKGGQVVSDYTIGAVTA